MYGTGAIAAARFNILKNTIRGISGQSPLKIAVISLLSTLFWIGALYLFFRGLSFFYRFPIVGPILIDELMYIFFAVLFIMLVLSAIIVCHGTIFGAREVEFLFSRPVDHRVLYFYRLAQSGIYSSWAFLFLGVPFLLAYGAVKDLSPWFYATIPLWFSGFTALPTALAGLIVLAVTAYFNYRRSKYFFIALTAAGLAALAWYYKSIMAPEFRVSDDIALFMDTFLHHLRLLKHSFYPGYWMASSVVEAGNNRVMASAQYFFVYGAASLLMLQVSWFAAGSLYYRGWLASRNRRVNSIPSPDQGAVNRLLSTVSLLPRPTAALITKDIKIFFRDFRQWSQFAIYLAILAVYIVNLRAMPGSVNNPYWEIIVTFLNYTAASLVLAGFSVRFLFPQMSLEGSKIWVLGLAPITFKEILLQKFLIYCTALLLVSETLMVMTNIMLETDGGLFMVSCGMTALTALGLAGLALGLGSIYPDFNEDDPSKIVSGFGGTLNLILALAYIIAMAALFAVPYFLYRIHGLVSEGSFTFLLAGSWFAAVLLTVLTGIVPLVRGYGKLRHREF